MLTAKTFICKCSSLFHRCVHSGS
uniref:Uncharacterized protein n=1 Tax=Anguilla anguilla TaxID=7936 RepID=A0A0E9QLP0_ANGAN